MPNQEPKKIYIRTYGCQMNVADSESMRGVLAAGGWKITDSEKDADVILLNTCSVRKMAEEKVFSKLGQLNEEKKQGRKLIIGVTGCMAQSYGEKIFGRAPYVDMVCGTYRFGEIKELLVKVIDSKSRIVDVDTDEVEIPAAYRHFKKANISAFVPIMRGCNNRCSYCVVPSVRGPERCRTAEDIVSEITSLGKKGYKEVTLLGQNVNSYGSGTDFIGLLREVNKIPGIERIRFVTSHPKDASVELFNTMRELEKVCPYLHLPVQSGSNKILKLMNRGYTREHYLELIKSLKGILLSTDIIVGFPGETESDFQDTYDLMKRVRFDSAFVFKYSPRQNTAAARLTDDVPVRVKQERNNQLLKMQDEISLEKNREMIGVEVSVLVEGRSKSNRNRLMGRTETNKIVVFEGKDELIGGLINAKVIDVTAHTLYGASAN